MFSRLRRIELVLPTSHSTFSVAAIASSDRKSRHSYVGTEMYRAKIRDKNFGSNALNAMKFGENIVEKM